MSLQEEKPSHDHHQVVRTAISHLDSSSRAVTSVLRIGTLSGTEGVTDLILPHQVPESQVYQVAGLGHLTSTLRLSPAPGSVSLVPLC